MFKSLISISFESSEVSSNFAQLNNGVCFSSCKSAIELKSSQTSTFFTRPNFYHI
ncbi:hypothetical protein DDB_G0276643 [Dictyostelium discoideum AX4]|uniref:Uncharacterized protein n=1 Tax=Dictyostelium discoideum TaxID=44689 RepID=Q551E3_DICDI|nr:hypothetical protein DDB_G0276643 [Dictyostelium discoideum AX4]EAL69134.1 hypothetical protein DDB_G0276643 [Dictyostelium discoideum AX4]|eukprot:XP_643050.1 hypothetical protein DDB_G0276643 [Dictyostelium discoideum AX4]